MQRSPYALYDLRAPDGAPLSDLDPFSPEFLADPHPGHAALRDLGPAVWLTRYDVLAVARYDAVRAVLGNPRTFCSSRGVGMEDFVRHGRYRLPSLILEADPPEHGRARSVLSRALSPATIARLREGFAAVADRMVADLVARRRFDGIADLARAFPLAVFPDAVGMAKEGRDKLLPHAEMLFNSFGPRNALFTASLGGVAFDWVEAQGRRERLQPGGLGMMIHEAADRGEIGAVGRLARPLAAPGRARHDDQRLGRGAAQSRASPGRLSAAARRSRARQGGVRGGVAARIAGADILPHRVVRYRDRRRRYCGGDQGADAARVG